MYTTTEISAPLKYLVIVLYLINHTHGYLEHIPFCQKSYKMNAKSCEIDDKKSVLGHELAKLQGHKIV